MRTATVFVLGLWIGATVAVLGVVGYSFPGIDRALASNAGLEKGIGFDRHDTAAKKVSVPWVVVGELNRHYFVGFNRAQLGLAVVALALSWRRRRSFGFVLIALAALAAVVLTFHLAPEITDRGRALDFVPRDPPPQGQAGFEAYHDVYTGLEAVKTVFLVVAAVLTARRSRGAVAACATPD